MPVVKTPDILKSKSGKHLVSLVLPAVLLLASCTGSTPGTGGSQAAAATATTGSASSAQPAAQDGSAGGRSGRGAGKGGRGDAGGGAVPVTTALVTAASLPVYVQGVGNVEAFTTVEIRSQVTGPL